MFSFYQFRFLDFQAVYIYFLNPINKLLTLKYMADTSDFRNGLIIKFKNDLYTITEFQHVKPGKGGAFVRTTLKNLRTGKVLDNTFRAGEGIDIVRVERRKYQFLYREGNFLVCMDNDTYEQINIPVELFGNGEKYLKEGEEIDILFNGDEIINVEIPIFVNLKVVHTEPGFKGNTATGAMKPAELETGASISVPLFIDVDDLLRVDTRTGEYVERLKS
jgi:elongation factor P